MEDLPHQSGAHPHKPKFLKRCEPGLMVPSGRRRSAGMGCVGPVCLNNHAADILLGGRMITEGFQRYRATDKVSATEPREISRHANGWVWSLAFFGTPLIASRLLVVQPF